VDDDELTRARRALRGTDPEIDLARVYAESRARARDAAAGDPHEGWADAEGVEILLRDAGPEALRRRSRARHRPALVWGAAAAAAAVLAVSLACPPALRALPGGPPAPNPSAPTDPAAESSPSPTVGLTPAQVVTTAARAMAGEGCGVKTRSTLGDKPTVRVDDAEPSGEATPKPIRLDSQPLQALQAVAVRTTLGLSTLDGTDHRLDDDLTIEDLDGLAVVQLRITPADAMVLGGDVTRIDLLVDPTTWLPRAAETRAVSDQGDRYLVRSEFSWMACDGPSMSPTEGPGS
jgi:hypothetical protein